MISKIRQISKDFYKQFPDKDLELLKQIDNIDIKKNKIEIEQIFQEDHKLVLKKLSEKGLGDNFKRLNKDIEYMIEKAFLSINEERTTLKEKIYFILARLMICEYVVVQHLSELLRRINSFKKRSSFIRENDNIPVEKISEIFNLSKDIDFIRRHTGAIKEILEDYCHYIDYVFNMLGEEADLFGKRRKSDVYLYQLDFAIKQLFTSRTASCDAAAFLIRSRLEIFIRNIIFRNDFQNNEQFFLIKPLELPKLLNYCNKAEIKFTYSYNTINKIWDNLNIIIHFGLRLNLAALCYMYWLSCSFKILVDKGMSKEECNNYVKQKALKILNLLIDDKYVKKFDENDPYFKSCIDIFWRY
ncbi:MAG: hypothetical protein ACFFDN_35860 [Candidatus Hodarchaeota archaeon]